MKRHPEIFPSTEERIGDGDLGAITQKIKNVEALEKRAVGVGHAMKNVYPSKWAGDDDVVVRKEEEMEGGDREKGKGKDGKEGKDGKGGNNNNRLIGMLSPSATGSVGSDERKQKKMFDTILRRAVEEEEHGHDI